MLICIQLYRIFNSMVGLEIKTKTTRYFASLTFQILKMKKAMLAFKMI